MTDADLFARLDDIEALGLTLWGEARSESLSGRAAVACVVRTRIADPRWPDTAKAVCLQPKQFSVWNSGRDPNSQAVRLVAESLLRGEPPHPLVRECLWLAQGVLDGIVLDSTGGANHYLVERMYRLFPPKWVSGMAVTATIGAHIFLKG